MKPLLLFSIIVSLTINSWADDRFVPCMRFGGIKQCISVPLAERADDAVAKKFQPSSGNARVYIVRPYTTEPQKKSEVFLDGQLAAEIAPATYVVLNMSPGAHHIRVHTDQDADVLLNVAAGGLYYVKYQLNLLFNTVHGELTILDAQKGESQILISKLIRS